MIAYRWFIFLILAMSTAMAQEDGTDQKIRCTIEVDSREWKRNAPAAITGTIENISDGPLDAFVTPTLYLAARGFGGGDKYWAPVDVLKDRPLTVHTIPIHAITQNPLHLTFKKRGASIHFRIDAQHLLWDRTISPIWPSKKFFGVVEPDTYAVRLVLESKRSESQSNRVTVVVSSDSKQAVFPAK
jgi:hypothetical protein